MSFFKYNNRLLFSKVIFSQSQFFSLSCKHCSRFIHDCVVMNSHSKCAVCIHRNHFYVSIFLKTLNRTHDKLKINLVVIEEELSRVLLKINRFRKQMKLVTSRIVQKIQCVTAELNSDNDEIKNKEVSFVFAFVSFSQLIENLFNDF